MSIHMRKQMTVVSQNRARDGTRELTGNRPYNLEAVVPHESLQLDVQNSKMVATQMGHKLKPSGGVEGKIRGGIYTVNWPFAQRISLGIGGGVLPLWVRVAMDNCLSKLQIWAHKHIMEGTASYVFIGINKNNEVFPHRSPHMQISTNVSKEQCAGTIPNALCLEISSLLVHDRKVATRMGCFARNVEGNEASDVSIPALKFGPGIPAKLLIIDASVHHL